MDTSYFLGILMLIFQSIFEWASVPMNLIDGLFANLSEYAKTQFTSRNIYQFNF